MNEIAKMIWSTLGAAVGWIVGEFSPTFPLVVSKSIIKDFPDFRVHISKS